MLRIVTDHNYRWLDSGLFLARPITELGFLLEGSAYIAKGSKIKLRSSRIKEIFGIDTIEAYSTGFNSELSGTYLTSFEIDPDNKDLISRAKYWIKVNRK